MIHLKKISFERIAEKPIRFPFNVPTVRETPEIEFSTPVTFFVGENGSGKSTVMEAIAAGAGSVTVGGEDVSRDPTLVHARELADEIRFVWQKKTRRGFFLRSEDFFRFIQRLAALKNELQTLRDSYEEEPDSYGLRLAKGAVDGQKNNLVQRYGENLDANSHGESFLKLFSSRLVPDGLYLLDEPETPFSPTRQMALMVLMHESVKKGCQFIVATHSPILMAFPGATILNFDERPVRSIAYDEIEHVSFMKSFLNNPERMLRDLFDESIRNQEV
jgi:predicted ATPase